jgi:hypothetical protein
MPSLPLSTGWRVGETVDESGNVAVWGGRSSVRTATEGGTSVVGPHDPSNALMIISTVDRQHSLLPSFLLSEASDTLLIVSGKTLSHRTTNGRYMVLHLTSTLAELVLF